MAYNEKQKEYTMNYLKKLKEVRFRVRPDEYEEIKAFADSKNQSVRAFIIEAINEKIKRDS